MVLSDIDKRMKQIEARSKADEIIKAIDKGQDSDWIRNALRVLRKIGPSLGILTTCDLWNTLENLGIVSPNEPRAMAAVIMKAKQFGWIKSTDMWRTSSRKVNHGRPVRVWRWVP